MAVGKSDIEIAVNEYVLSARARTVLMKRLYDDEKIEDIARDCDVSVGTVKNDIKKWLPTVKNHLLL